MKVKRYFSHSMQDALRQVREDLGPEAVILSNLKQGGGVEILATAEYDEQESAQSVVEMTTSTPEVSPSELARRRARQSLRLQEEMNVSKKRVEELRSGGLNAHADKSAHRVLEQGATNTRHVEQHTAFTQAQGDDIASVQKTMQAEIQELRSLITEQARKAEPPSNPSEDTQLNQIGSLLDERLESMGLDKRLRKQLCTRLSKESDLETAWAKARKQMHGALHTEYSEIIDMGGVVSLVGPTGSGKTTTIGKLAARYVMRHGADSLALVTTDRYRIAAHEQLKVFGRILNVPVHVVDEDNCLDAILDKLSDRKLVLIDTAGLMQTDACWSQQLKELKMSAHQIQNYLVMPATGQYRVMETNYKHYKMVGLAGTVVTKLDEAVSLGEILTYLITTKLSCAYITDGQRVPEDIHLATKQVLMNKAEELLNSSERWVTIPSREHSGVEAEERFPNFA